MNDVRSDFELSGYSVAELNDLIEMAKKEIARKEQTQLQDVRIQMERLASSVGKTVEEIINLDKKKKGSKALGRIKYRNPANPEQTWTGRGKRPRWLQQALDQGADLEDFAIQ